MAAIEQSGAFSLLWGTGPLFAGSGRSEWFRIALARVCGAISGPDWSGVGGNWRVLASVVRPGFTV